MTKLKPREERKPLILPARMLADQGWQDTTICNVSSRGMMLRCLIPPRKNSYVEVRHGSVCIVGRVVWSEGSHFGIKAQDNIDFADLLAQRPGQRKKVDGDRRVQRRTLSAQRSQVRVLSQEDTSRIFARVFDWSVIVFAIVLGTIVLADVASDALQPLDQVKHALAAASSPD